MSWLFSQALVEEYSAGTSLAGQPGAQLSVMPTPHKFLHNGKTMESSDHSRFGLTSRVLTVDLGEAVLTSYLLAFPARTSARQEKAPDSMASVAASGAKRSGSFAKLSQDGRSWKTAQCSLLEDSDESLQTWPRWGSMRNGECWERPVSGPHTIACESGFSLLTPSGCRSGKNHVGGRLDEWGGKSNPWRGTDIGKTSSPAFEEWVMGWPEQWTALTQYETAKFQEWSKLHGRHSAGIMPE
jgi:hypothetical protein